MKTDTLVLAAAIAAAAVLVLSARRATAAPAVATRPSFGGPAGSLWDDQATAAYRAQLAAEAPGWYGP